MVEQSRSAVDVTETVASTTIDEAINGTNTDDKGDVDGRTMRRRRNRDAVIRALIDLINEGELEPTVAKIADRAEVSHRSIFRYFDDLNDLAKTAVETELANVWPQSIVHDLGEGNLEYRISQFVAAQVRVFQRTHALGRVARGKMVSIPDLEAGIAKVVKLRRAQVLEQFAPELSLMTEADAASLATAITVLLSFEAFDMQRRTFEMSIAEVTENWQRSMHRLLRNPA